MTPTTMHASAVSGHRNSLDDVQPRMAKADIKEIENRDFREEIGRAIERAVSLAGLSKKEVAGMIQREPAQLARWIAGTERPQFDALFSVQQLRKPLCVALAQMAGASVHTHVEFTKRTA